MQQAKTSSPRVRVLLDIRVQSTCSFSLCCFQTLAFHFLLLPETLSFCNPLFFLFHPANQFSSGIAADIQEFLLARVMCVCRPTVSKQVFLPRLTVSCLPASSFFHSVLMRQSTHLSWVVMIHFHSGLMSGCQCNLQNQLRCPCCPSWRLKARRHPSLGMIYTDSDHPVLGLCHSQH